MRVVVVVLAFAGCRFGFDEVDPHAPDAAATGCQIAAISAGGLDTCALTTDHALYCWGRNGHGELGSSDFLDRAVPVRVPFDRAVGISAGVEETTCALRDDGTVWCWGADAEDELTDNLMVDNPSPTQIVDVNGQPFGSVLEVTVGERHACARRDDGLWCWGWDAFGQIGDQVAQAHVANPVHSVANVDGELASYGHTCAWIGPERAIECWGDNDTGQVGNNTNTTPVLPPSLIGLSSVLGGASAYRHTCVVDTSGLVYCWGNNGDNQLGDNTGMSRPYPMPVLAQGGALFVNAVEVGAGDNSACARKDDGSVWCWGSSADGQLGNGGTVSSGFPVEVALAGPAKLIAIGNSHGCAVLADGARIQCWGNNTSGQLGNNSGVSSTVPVDAQLPTCDR